MAKGALVTLGDLASFFDMRRVNDRQALWALSIERRGEAGIDDTGGTGGYVATLEVAGTSAFPAETDRNPGEAAPMPSEGLADAVVAGRGIDM